MMNENNYNDLLQQTRAKTDNHYWIRDLLVLSLLISIFFTLFLGAYPLLTPDEARYSEVAREMVISGDYITPRQDGLVLLDKPVLHYWLQVIAIKLFGLKDWVLRIWPALFGAMGCLFTYIAGRVLHDRRTGILSAIILATSPLYFALAHYANLDLEVAVLITATLFSFAIAMKFNFVMANGKYKYILFTGYIFMGLAFLAKGLIGIILPGLIIGTWIMITRRWHLLRELYLLHGLLIVIFIAAPWYILVQQANPDFFQHFFITEHFLRFLTTDFANHQPFWFYIPLILGGFFPWSVFTLTLALSSPLPQPSPASGRGSFMFFLPVPQKRSRAREPELFLLLWPILIFIFFSLPHSKLVSYILPAMPPLALMIGYYLNKQWDNKPGRIISIFIVAFLTVTAIALGILPLLGIKFVAPTLNLFIYTASGLFLLSAIFILIKLKSLSIKKITTIFIFMNSMSLLVLFYAMPQAKLPSIKPLIMSIRGNLKPSDEIISYYRYYYDLPLYTEKYVKVVNDWNSITMKSRDNWERELWRGKNNQIGNTQLIDEKDFLRIWYKSNHRLLIFTDTYRYKQLKIFIKKNLYLIDSYRDTVLLSNYPSHERK